MKNIHLLPTYKPSRLHIINRTRKLDYSKNCLLQFIGATNQNIYITSESEDINENDYIITKDGRLVQVSYLMSKDLQGASKVVLTTDQDLIKDGVQSITDEFLEWFVKNPSCEEVEVKKGFADGTAYGYNFLDYKIIIPKEEQCICEVGHPYNNSCCKIHGGSLKEEPKQETLEEVLKLIKHKDFTEISIFNNGFIKGAKWQAERMYSEEEVIEILNNYDYFIKNDDKVNSVGVIKEWFEQFKKK